jgi:serine/threonine protein kinase/Tol biopolymer transport system component
VHRLSTALSDRYRIERELGAGGMATVYLAEDLKHDRKIAIKVLRPELAAVIGAERFLKEIKTTANLQHPHILGLIDSGEVGGLLWYAMPFVQGESLRDRLQREKQLPIPDAVRIATEVAGALDYAHRHGVIHRDIKPENILLHDGGALVADFGIALAASTAGTRMTETGMSLGTPHYMSPEQAMGEREITARSDVYALGCVTYEMLIGDPPFTGSTAQAIIAKVVTEHPPSLIAQRHTIPPQVEAAVLTALEKLPADRFASAAEFSQALRDESRVERRATRDGKRALSSLVTPLSFSLVAGLAVVFAIIAVIAWQRPATVAPLRRLSVTMDQYQRNGAIEPPTLSPDGRRAVYATGEGNLVSMRLDQLTAKPVSGATTGWAPFFSPDSKEVAYYTGFPGAIKIYSFGTETSRTLVADSTYASGGSWSDDGWIYYVAGPRDGAAIMRIRPAGGKPELVAAPDTTRDLFYYWPQALPGGSRLLLTVWPLNGDPYVGVLDLSSHAVTTLAPGIQGLYSPTGHLLVMQGDGVLRAAPFDPSRGSVTGGFTTMVEGMLIIQGTRPASLSNDGSLSYVAGTARAQVMRVTRDGHEEPVDPTWIGDFKSIELSPDGSRLAVAIQKAARTEIWVRAMPNGPIARIATGGTQSYRQDWSSDGRTLLFNSNRQGTITTYRAPADGSAPPTRVFHGMMSVDETILSKDGTWLVFRRGSGGGRDIYAMHPGVDSSIRPLVASPAEEFSPALSPDGKWLAYASDETGSTEVYVRPFPDVTAGKFPVSRHGGSEPVWSHTGRELFFRDGAKRLLAAQIAAGNGFTMRGEKVLFAVGQYDSDNRNHAYTVSPDDQTFLFVKPMEGSGSDNQVILVLNWFDELQRKVGGR